MTNPKNWQQIRAELMQLKNKLGIVDEEFRPLSPYDNHQEIEEKIYQTFCQIDSGNVRSVWLWTSFKQDNYAVSELSKQPETYLHKLIDNHESIWLGASCTHQNKHKIWYYEGKIQAMQTLIGETHYFDEMYFISKKFAWLICINHHDVLMATGGDMPQKLQALEKTMNGETL